MSAYASRGRRRAAAAVTAMAISLGALSCGEDDSEGNRPPKPVGMLPDPDRQLRDRVARGSGVEAGVQEVIDDVQDGLLTLSGWSVCNELTERAQLRVAKPGRCVEAYDRILRSGRNPTTRRIRSKVVSVELHPNGDDAIAVLTSPGRRPFRVRLVSSLGELRLPGLDLEDPTGLRSMTK